MRNRSYAHEVNQAKLLLSGLRQHSQTLARRGLDQQFLASMENLYGRVQTLDSEQEALKSRLQEKTSELVAAREALALQSSEVRKLVKLDFPREAWKEFGITDAR